MARTGHRRSRTFGATLLALLSATALAGCQQKAAELDNADLMSTSSTAPASYEATAELGKAWQSDPSSISKGVAYANALERLGQQDKQFEVYARLLSAHPENGKLAGLYGKKLVMNGRTNDAVPILERAANSPNADWKIHSALGSAYDQQGLYQKARDQYNLALATDANNLTVLNNFGMSYALEGNLKEAEAALRRAHALPGSQSQPRIRQNLALVIGLQGRFDEARRMASEDLPQEQIDANMDYLQTMLAQPNTWKQLADSKG
ncbi:MAG: tetratricopeptide repeat protein [Nitratireductor sp.]|nr:tetratricopeptide repeat protein [Nitratireductor sp.]